MENLTKLLEQLAEKLGTTAEQLWGVLLQQVEVEKQLCEVWMNIGLFGFCGIGVFLMALFVIGLIRDWDMDGAVFGLVFGIIFLVIGGIMYYINYSELLTLTNNPKYWALQEILSKI